MSLLSEQMTDCVILNKITQNDGYGGFETIYKEGASFKAAIVRDSSLQARVAEKQGVTDYYTVTTTRNTPLEYHDVIKRLSDGKILRVTTNSIDRQTPSSAGLDMRQVNAEEYVLAGGVVEDEG